MRYNLRTPMAADVRGGEWRGRVGVEGAWPFPPFSAMLMTQRVVVEEVEGEGEEGKLRDHSCKHEAPCSASLCTATTCDGHVNLPSLPHGGRLPPADCRAVLTLSGWVLNPGMEGGGLWPPLHLLTHGERVMRSWSTDVFKKRVKTHLKKARSDDLRTGHVVPLFLSLVLSVIAQPAETEGITERKESEGFPCMDTATSCSIHVQSACRPAEGATG